MILVDVDHKNPDDRLRAFADAIIALRRGKEDILLQPIRSFRPLTVCNDLLQKAGIPYETTPITTIARPRAVGDVYEIIKSIKAEAIMCCCASPESDHKDLLESPKADKAANYERPYLSLVDKYGVFVFLADGHPSLELIGTKRAIANSFLKMLNLEQKM